MRLHKKKKDGLLIFMERPDIQAMTVLQAKDLLRSCNKYKTYKTKSGLRTEAWVYAIGITREQDILFVHNKRQVPDDVLQRSLALSRKIQYVLTHNRTTEGLR